MKFEHYVDNGPEESRLNFCSDPEYSLDILSYLCIVQ